MNEEEARQNEIRDRLLNALEWLEEIKGSTSSDENYENADIIQKFINCYQTEINRQKAEIERYKGVIKNLESDVAKTKVDTTKEFAKYLIDNDEDGVIKTIDLPELVCDFLHPVEKVEHDSLCETETYKTRKG